MNTPEQDNEAARELDEMLKADTLRPADVAALRAIMASASVEEVTTSIRGYYRDRDRADRTPRAFLYLHIGMITGACDTIRATRELLSTAAGMLDASAEHLTPIAAEFASAELVWSADQMRMIARRLREAGGIE